MTWVPRRWSDVHLAFCSLLKIIQQLLRSRLLLDAILRAFGDIPCVVRMPVRYVQCMRTADIMAKPLDTATFVRHRESCMHWCLNYLEQSDSIFG